MTNDLKEIAQELPAIEKTEWKVPLLSMWQCD